VVHHLAQAADSSRTGGGWTCRWKAQSSKNSDDHVSRKHHAFRSDAVHDGGSTKWRTL